jgi:hypothetical protein
MGLLAAALRTKNTPEAQKLYDEVREQVEAEEKRREQQ